LAWALNRYTTAIGNDAKAPAQCSGTALAESQQ
jgi:hypothetical protein